jgi:hypothetical protein
MPENAGHYLDEIFSENPHPDQVRGGPFRVDALNRLLPGCAVEKILKR